MISSVLQTERFKLLILIAFKGIIGANTEAVVVPTLWLILNWHRMQVKCTI